MPEFATPEPISVTVELSVGEVRAVASDRTETVVEVRPSSPHEKADVRAAEQTRVEYSNGALLIRGPKFRNALFGRIGSVDVLIELPAGSQFRGDSDMGDFRAQGRLGECRLKTSMGDIHLDETARLQANTAAGNITVARATGHAEVGTGSGDVRIGEIDGTAVLKNSNGETRVSDVTGDIRVNSANGDIVLGRAHAGVNAKTANGDIRIDEIIRDVVVLETAVGELEVGIRKGSAAWLVLNTMTGQVHNSLTAADGPSGAEETVEVRARSYTGDIVVRRS